MKILRYRKVELLDNFSSDELIKKYTNLHSLQIRRFFSLAQKINQLPKELLKKQVELVTYDATLKINDHELFLQALYHADKLILGEYHFHNFDIDLVDYLKNHHHYELRRFGEQFSSLIDYCVRNSLNHFSQEYIKCSRKIDNAIFIPLNTTSSESEVTIQQKIIESLKCLKHYLDLRQGVLHYTFEPSYAERSFLEDIECLLNELKKSTNEEVFSLWEIIKNLHCLILIPEKSRSENIGTLQNYFLAIDALERHSRNEKLNKNLTQLIKKLIANGESYAENFNPDFVQEAIEFEEGLDFIQMKRVRSLWSEAKNQCSHHPKITQVLNEINLILKPIEKLSSDAQAAYSNDLEQLSRLLGHIQTLEKSQTLREKHHNLKQLSKLAQKLSGHENTLLRNLGILLLMLGIVIATVALVLMNVPALWPIFLISLFYTIGISLKTAPIISLGIGAALTGAGLTLFQLNRQRGLSRAVTEMTDVQPQKICISHLKKHSVNKTIYDKEDKMYKNDLERNFFESIKRCLNEKINHSELNRETFSVARIPNVAPHAHHQIVELLLKPYESNLSFTTEWNLNWLRSQEFVTLYQRLNLALKTMYGEDSFEWINNPSLVNEINRILLEHLNFMHRSNFFSNTKSVIQILRASIKEDTEEDTEKETNELNRGNLIFNFVSNLLPKKEESASTRIPCNRSLAFQDSSHAIICKALNISIDSDKTENPERFAKKGFQVSEHMTKHALDLMGITIEIGEYIELSAIKKKHRANLIEFHPDKSHTPETSHLLNRAIVGYWFILEFEYPRDPGESEDARNIRLLDVINDKLLPILKDENKMLRKEIMQFKGDIVSFRQRCEERLQDLEQQFIATNYSV